MVVVSLLFSLEPEEEVIIALLLVISFMVFHHHQMKNHYLSSIFSIVMVLIKFMLKQVAATIIMGKFHSSMSQND